MTRIVCFCWLQENTVEFEKTCALIHTFSWQVRGKTCSAVLLRVLRAFQSAIESEAGNASRILAEMIKEEDFLQKSKRN